MVVASLRSEMEQHLERNPHPLAPGGFRDRFDQLVEHHETETDPEERSRIEADMRRIRHEAEAAANAGRRFPLIRPLALVVAAIAAAGAATAAVVRFRRG